MVKSNLFVDQRIEKFFAEYESRFNRALVGSVDAEAFAGSFTDCFLEANPNGVLCGKNDEKFRAAIPQGMEFYKTIGTKSMKIVSLSITLLDDYHSMVKVHWNSFYEKKDSSKEQIDFDVIYFLRTANESIKVFAYITGDEQKALRERGLIPG